jgi:phage terminase large subunit GpA-like protein
VFQRPVLEAITDPANADGVVYIGPSQRGGKTEILLNASGYYIDSDPASQIVVTYSLDMAKKLSKQRFAGMFRETPALRGKVREARSRDSGNTILEKEFAGGDLTLVGSNSAGGLSMSPKRVGLFDELDRWSASAGTEGDPLALALNRLESYWNSVKVYATSPGIRNASRSWRLWERSDQREWTIRCPHCDATHVPDWYENVQWRKDSGGNHLPETATYACLHCGSELDEVERWRACERGDYVATADFSGLAGFRISALGIAHVSLEKLVRRWVNAQGNPEEIKVFKTTVLSEWWDEQYTTVDDTGLKARREPYPIVEGSLAVPAPVALLTAGIDVQDNRIEGSVYGWGHAEESWLIAHSILFGDPSVLATWDELDRWLLTPWPREAGGVDYVRGACVDTGGHHTQAAYDFCGPRFRRVTPDGGRAFVFAVKGSHGSGEIWPRRPSKITTKVPLWPIRVDPAKDQIYGRLALAEPGPGFVHFHEQLGDDFFEGLTSERVTTRTNRRGFVERYWELRRAGIRNEPLDCAVYAVAALCGLRANGFDLEAEVQALDSRPIFSAPVGQGGAPPLPAAPTSSPRSRKRRADWVGSQRDWVRR